MEIFFATLFVVAKYGNVHLLRKKIIAFWYICIIEYYSDIKINEL